MKNARRYEVHVDLRHLPAGHLATLHAGGRKYELIPHRPETLAAAQRKSGALQAEAAGDFTHYAPDVAFPSTRIMSYWVNASPPGGSWGERTVPFFGLYFPNFADAAETQLTFSWDDIAVSILFHHPALFNLRTDPNDPSKNIGPMIQQIIRQSPYFGDFVNALEVQTQPWTLEEVKDYQGQPVYITTGPNQGQVRHQLVYSADTLQAMTRPLKYMIQEVKDTEALENWNWRVSPGVLSVPAVAPGALAQTDAGATFNLTSAAVGSQAGFEVALASNTSTDRAFTIDVTNKFARYVSMYVQFLDNNNNFINPDLEFLYQAKTVPTALTAPPATPTAVSPDVRALFQKLPQAIELSGDTLLEQPDAVELPTMVSTPLSVVEDKTNQNVYLCYKDKNGDNYSLYKVTPWDYRPSFTDPLYEVIRLLYSGISPFGENAQDLLQTQHTRYLGYVDSIPLILAIPTGWSHASYTIPMPPGAAKARILSGGGLGGYIHWVVSKDDDADLEAIISFIVGGLLTAVINILIPTILLPSGGDEGGVVEEQIQKLLTEESAQKLFRDILPIALTVLGVSQVVTSVVAGGTANSLLTSFTSAVIGVVLDSKSIAVVLAAQEAVNIAEEDVPLVGQIAQAINVLATLAQLAETTIEELIAPIFIQNVITETFDCRLTVNHDPLDHSGFPATARWYNVKLVYNDGTTTRELTNQPFQQGGQVQTAPLAVTIPNLPATGFFQISVEFYASDAQGKPITANPVGVGTSPELDASSAAAQTPVITIKEEIPPLDETTAYTQSRKLGYDAQAGRHIWQGDATYPAATVSDLNPSSENDDKLSSLTDISFSQLTGLLGYGWEAGGQDVPLFGSDQPGGLDLNLHTAQSISSTSDPEQGLKFTPAGFRDNLLICYELLPPKAAAAPTPGADEPLWRQLGFARAPYNFFIQPGAPYTVGAQTFVPQFVRSVSLDDSGALDLNQTTAWGRFPTSVVDVAVHPSGKLVGLYATGDAVRLYIIDLPTSPMPEDLAPWPLHLASGKGSRINLLQHGVAVGCTGGGAILVLDDVAGVVQAFDVHGNPLVSYFTPGGSQPSNQMPLRPQQGTPHYLDMAVEHRGFVYVLLYIETTGGTRVEPSAYLLDIYKPDGSFLVSATRTKPLPTARLTVDLFRNLYTLNYEQFNGPRLNNAQAGRVEPTVSELIPSIPDGWSVPGARREG